MKTIKINLYTFAELSDEAREYAINDAIIFLDNEPTEYEDENGEIKSEYINHTEKEAEDFINANEYLFFKNGEQAHTITYFGAHPRTGESELNLFGETYKF